jgi:DNA-binding beta-propeller fold protein YncE
MTKRSIILLPAFFFLNIIQVQARDAMPLRLVQTIPLANVEGRIDHLAIDLKRQRLFVAALGNNTVEVIDLKAGKQIRTLRGFHEPQGILFIPEFNRLIVSNGGDGTCQILDGDSFDVIQSVRLSSDADNIRYDAAKKYLYLGYGEGGLAVIDAMTAKHIGDIPLGGHPESFQLERSGPRIFVNVPTAKRIAVVDREKQVVVTTWLAKNAQENFPMALDESHHRLFVGFRKPPKITVLDTESGREITSLSTAGDCDDIFLDSIHSLIYMSCGEGFLDVFKQGNSDRYRIIAKLSTAPGARTAFFVPELGRLYLAVPHRADQGAEIRIYKIQ